MKHENMYYINDLIDYCYIIKRYNPRKCLQIVEECKHIHLSENISFDSLKNLYFFYNEFLNKVPSEEYEIHINLTKKIISIMQLWMKCKCNLDNRYKYCCVFLYISEGYQNLCYLFSSMGMPGLAWDYCLLSLMFDPNEIERLLDFDKAFELWNEAIDIGISSTRVILISNSALYFYLSRILGHNREDCFKVFRITSIYLKMGNRATESDIEYLTYFASFLITTNDENFNDKLAYIVINKLKTQYEIERNRQLSNALLICQTLSYVSFLINEDNFKWALKGIDIIENNEGMGDAFSYAQMYLIVLLNKDVFEKSKIKEVIIEFLKHLEKQNNSKIINWLQRSRLSQIINMCIASAVNRGEYEFAIKCAYIWKGYDFDDYYDLPQDEIIILIIDNFWNDKLAYLIWDGENPKLVQLFKSVTLEELLEAKNNFEGTWTAIIGKQYTNLDSIERPDPSKSFIYLNKLIGYYSPNEFVNSINSVDLTKKIRIIESTWQNSPLTALIGLYSDKEISNFVSRKLQEQTRISKVLIWCDPDSSLFTANIEKEAIIKVLKLYKTVSIEIYSGDECTYELFVNKYKNCEFDLIWVMCHADYDYNNPANSKLHISVASSIGLLDLVDANPQRQSRRLLVLNACESGYSTVRYQSMNFIGFGPALSNRFQSVIGHLWPVDSLAAAVFGVILCHNLLRDIPWGIAVNISRKSLAKDNYEILSLLNNDLKLDVGTEIIKAIENRSDELNKLYYWGSPIFFE